MDNFQMFFIWFMNELTHHNTNSTSNVRFSVIDRLDVDQPLVSSFVNRNLSFYIPNLMVCLH